jgi:hypothetical protein
MSKTYHFTPFDNRGLGHAYNAACAIVPNADDRIILMDADVMMLPGTWGQHVEDAIDRHPAYDAYVCMATRTWAVGSQQLRLPDGIREERDLGRLAEVVTTLAATRYAEVIPWPDKRQPSGFFMALRKSVWTETPFPLLGVQGLPRIGIETAWFRAIRAKGRKVGVMTGLAAIHFYRMDRQSTKDIGYLKQK